MRHSLYIALSIGLCGLTWTTNAWSQKSKTAADNRGSIVIAPNQSLKTKKPKVKKKGNTADKGAIEIKGNEALKSTGTGGVKDGQGKSIRIRANPTTKGQLTDLNSMPEGSQAGAIHIVNNPRLKGSGLDQVQPVERGDSNSAKSKKGRSSKKKRKKKKKRPSGK